jgi:diguanylate cyclase (GGDEF)-like protein
MLDIDNIRAINNTYGHLEGDNALRQFSGVLKNCIRDTDFAARYGGPKFIIATKVENGVEDLLKKVKDELAKYNDKGQKPYKISTSYGFDMYNAETGKHIEEFITHLDTLMKKQKQDHRRTGDDHTGEERK